MTQEEALALLLTQVDLCADPEVTETEARNALKNTMRYGNRADSSAVSYGDRIAVGGRLYRCVWDGETDTSVPTGLGHTRESVRISDGTATWQDIGPRPSRQYDLIEAKRALYTLRIERAAGLINTQDKDSKINYEALFAHWTSERSKLGRISAV